VNPAQHYMNLRLGRARELLMHSSLPIMQITIACGFHSSSHFCKAYRNLFGHPPSDERRRFLAAGSRVSRQPPSQHSHALGDAAKPEVAVSALRVA
jgi:AraC-like DNA-binding protein